MEKTEKETKNKNKNIESKTKTKTVTIEKLDKWHIKKVNINKNGI